MDAAKISESAYKGVLSKDCRLADTLTTESDIDDITHKAKMKNDFSVSETYAAIN